MLPVYTTKAAAAAFIPDLIDVTDEELCAAEHDIDRSLISISTLTLAGRKIDPAQMGDSQAQWLARAVAAQARYLRIAGDDIGDRPQFDETSADGVSTKGRIDWLSKKAKEYLALADLDPITGWKGNRARPTLDPNTLEHWPDEMTWTPSFGYGGNIARGGWWR